MLAPAGPGGITARAQAVTDLPGLPLDVRHFAAQSYNQQPTNWDFAQSPVTGLLYVANNDGVMEFDGETWRLISTTTHTAVQSLDVTSDGVVYVGMQGDIGYLAPDSAAGSLKYVSLFEELPRGARDFWNVWSVHAAREGVYFQSRNYLFRWDGEEMRVWKTESGFFRAFGPGDDFYVLEFGTGLKSVEDDSLVVIPEGGRFASMGVYMIAPAPDDELIIGTKVAGFFHYDGASLRPFPTRAEAYLRANDFYTGCALPGGGYALATLKGGVVTIDEHGRILQILNRERGLPENVVNDVFADEQGNLWLAFNNRGLARAQPQSALTVYDERLGLPGVARHMTVHGESFLDATGAGLFFKAPGAAGNAGATRSTLFKPRTDIGIPAATFGIEDDLIISGNRGISILANGAVQQISSDRTAFDFSESADGSAIFAGMENGVSKLRMVEGEWTIGDVLPSIKQEIISVSQDSSGALWLGTPQDGVIRVRLGADGTSAESIVRFDSTDGLPAAYTEIREFDGKTVFFTEDGMYRYRGSSIHPDTSGSLATSDLEPFYRDTLFQESAALIQHYERGDSIWAVYTEQIDLIVEDEEGRFTHTQPPVLQWLQSKYDISTFLVDHAGLIWVGADAGLIRFDPRVQMPDREAAPVTVRRIQSLAEGEPIWNGVYTQPEGEPRAYSFDHNDLRIEYATPIYSGLLDTRYQFRLLGQEDDWSTWESWTSETYTNLGPGDYTFQVRARTGEDIMHPMGALAFSILPPWYRTWWAYLSYIIFAALFGLAAVRYRQLVEENEAARRQAVTLDQEREANERLREANVELMKVNEFKDQVLSNTSHEMRTPLAAIIGFATLLREELLEVNDDHREFLGMIEKNGYRLQDTIESFVGVAKIRSGLVKMVPRDADASELVRIVSKHYAALAEDKDLAFDVDVPAGEVECRVDEHYLQRILKNLLGNAVKFTEAGSVGIRLLPAANALDIIVYDTGIGISEEFKEEMFDDFTQESTGMRRSYEGTGLGLPVVSRLVELLGGSIKVESKRGKGSTFTVTVPRYMKQAAENGAVTKS